MNIKRLTCALYDTISSIQQAVRKYCLLLFIPLHSTSMGITAASVKSLNVLDRILLVTTVHSSV